MRAIDGRRLEVRYQPRRGGESSRIISPHTIVDVAGVISVIILGEAQGYIGVEADTDWAEYVVLEVLPRGGEDPVALAPDYGLDEFGRALRRVRKAHERYLCENDDGTDDRHRSPVVVRRLSNGLR